MAQIRYLAPRPSYRRLLSAEDLARLGVDHPDNIVFEQSNDWTLEMNDGACDTLVSKLPTEFVVLEAPTEELPVAEDLAGNHPLDDQVDDSSADDPQESPDASLSEADAITKESPRAQRPRP